MATRPSLRWLDRVLRGLVLVATFVVATVAGFALHLDTRPAHKLATRGASFALSLVHTGRLELGSIDRLSTYDLRLTKAAFFDVHGHHVLTVTGLRVGFDLVSLVRAILSKDEVLALTIRNVHADEVDAEIVAEGSTGELSIVGVFTPPASSAPSSEPSSGRSLRLSLPSIEIGKGTAHAALRGAPPLDADLRQVKAQLLVSSAGVAVDVRHVDATLRGLGTDAHGAGTVTVRVPGAIGGTFRGRLDGFELDANGQFEDGRLDLAAKVPSASPAAVKRFVPEWPITLPVSADVTASGVLPELATHAKFTVGLAAVKVDGSVVLDTDPHATLAFTGEQLDARSFFAGAPHTEVGVRGDLEIASKSGDLSARIRAHSDSCAINGYPVPAIDAETTLGHGALSGSAEIHEPGMPAHAKFRAGPGGVVDVEVQAKAVDLRRVRSTAKRDVKGRGAALLRAHIENGNVTASIQANMGSVEVASVQIADARIAGELRGPVAAPEKLEGTAHLAVRSLKQGGFALENLMFDARGNLGQATVVAKVRPNDGPEITLAGILAPLGRPLLRDTTISLKRAPVLIEGNIVAFDPATESLHIRDIRVIGAGGRLTASARVQPNLVEIEAHGDGVDLDALARALALSRVMSGGRASVSLQLTAGRDAAKGRLDLHADQLMIGTIGPASVEIAADLDGGRLIGRASGSARALGTAAASWNVTLPGSWLDVASLRNATGTAELQCNDADLALFDKLLPRDDPVAKTEGRGYAKVEITRASSKAMLPDVKLTALTRGLALVLRGSGEGQGTRIAGVDFDANGTLDGASGQTSAHAVLRDAKGGLASVTGNVKVDVPHLVDDPDLALAELVQAPVDIRASAPPRRIADLPGIELDSGVEGEVGWELLLQGTLARPALRATFDGRGIVAAGSSLPADIHADAQYDWASTVLRGRGEVKLGSAPVATVTLDAKVPGSKPADFEGSARLDVKGFPLDVLGVLAKNDVAGRAFGSATVSKVQGKNVISADLRIADAVVANTPLGEAKLKVATDDAIVNASATLTGGRGSFNAEGKAGLAWVGLVPSVSSDVPVRGRIVAKEFSLVSAPGARGSSRMGGRINANFRVALDPVIDEQRRVDWVGRVDGSAVVQDGLAYIDLLGVDVHGINLSIRADSKEKGTHISFTDIKGRLRSTADNLGGSADLDFEGLHLVRGKAAIYSRNMPIFLHGAPQGHVTTDATLRLSRQPEQMLLEVDVPTLNVKLPEISSHKVIDVADNPEIVILQREVPSASIGTAFPWKIPIHLGNAVSIQRSDIEVKISGTPVVDLGSESRLTGSITLTPGGRIPVVGQVFSISQGLITFDADAPDDPAVDVTAQWRTANQTFVFVRVTGRLKKVQIALRSDPPLPEREVFALLFGGTAPDSRATTMEGTTGGAAAKTAALQGPVSQLNRLFGQSPVELRVGSTSESKPSYTAAVRVRENLWFEASTFKHSDTSGGTNTDQNVVAGTVDYRFHRSWSLRTQAGSLGGALDLLWQHRY
jgi:autotransporter translocation and assembly factor TamB